MGKYDKYFISGPGSGEAEGSGKCIAHIDNDTFEGAFEYWAHWAFEKPRNIPGWEEWDQVTHAPHMHKYGEVVMMLGTDPDNPMELGAEMDACMGPEMDRSINTRTSLNYIPANFVHGPSTVRKVTHPFIFIEINQSTKHTQKSLKEMVPDPAEREKMMFIDAGYEEGNTERKIEWPKGIGPRANEGK